LLSRDGREQEGYLNGRCRQKDRAGVSWRLQERISLARCRASERHLGDAVSSVRLPTLAHVTAAYADRGDAVSSVRLPTSATTALNHCSTRSTLRGHSDADRGSPPSRPNSRWHGRFRGVVGRWHVRGMKEPAFASTVNFGIKLPHFRRNLLNGTTLRFEAI
jgi:hypothetical protein